MTEKETAEAEQKQADETAKKEAYEKRQETLKDKSNEELIKVINETSSEARDYRHKKREVEDELNKLIADKKAAEEKKLHKAGELQKLIDSKSQELTDISKERDSYKVKADEADELKNAEIDETKKVMGEGWQDGYSVLTILELRNLRKSFALKPNPQGDNGATGDKTKVTLTAEQKKEAYEQYPYGGKEKAEENYAYNLIKYAKKEK